MLDLGWVSPLRSQTLWHAVAEVAAADARPTFSLCSPTAPYISIGYHRRLDEIDLKACEKRGLKVFRRRVGGGPVYCDASQLFFQLIVPAAGWPSVMSRAWEQAMEPAVAAFRALGAKAELVDGNDILADDRKICGTGAGRIGDSLVFVGDVIFDFDHDAMADSLNVSAGAKAEVARLTREHLASVSEVAGRTVTRSEAVLALTACYSEAFGGSRSGALSDAESARTAELDELFSSPEWLAAERAPFPSRIKVRSGVSVLVLGASWVSVVNGSIVGAGLTDAWMKPKAAASALASNLIGVPVERAALSSKLRKVSPKWSRSEEFIEAVLSAHRGGA